MNKGAAKLRRFIIACAITCIFAFSLAGCSSGASASGSGSSSSTSASSSSSAINLDKAVTQSGLSYKVSSSWTQSDNGSTASSSTPSSSSASAYSQCSFKTGEGNNALQVTTDDAAFTISSEDGLEKMRSAWIDYQGGTDWNVSKPETSKLDGASRTDYTCTWALKNGDKATVRVAFIQGDNVNANVSYYYNTGDDAIFDAVMKTVSID